jgi:hypothetical protein
MTTTRKLPAKIRNREAFKGNSLSAERPPYGNVYGTGRLEGADRDAFQADAPNIVYLLRSYATPIAWVTADGEVYLVGQRFSVTTSRQQSLVSLALS